LTTAENMGSRPRILLYAMYGLEVEDRGPVVRIHRMHAALSRLCDVEMVSGSRLGRLVPITRWLAGGGIARVDAIYVEASSSFATPLDVAFLALARLRKLPVGVYFRDAYQLFRTEYPLVHRRQKLLDWLWRLSTPLLKRIASHRFAPSRGLAQALRLKFAILLPPGTDPGLPDLGAGSQPIVGYVGALGTSDGARTLIEAIWIARASVPASVLRIVSPTDPRDAFGQLPPWVEWVPAGRGDLTEVLREVRVCVIPRPITPYTNLAVPLKLMDYLAFGKPIVATACDETARILEPAGAGLLVADRPDALATAVVAILRDDDLAAGLAIRARALADDPEMGWGARADTVLAALLPAPPRA